MRLILVRHTFHRAWTLGTVLVERQPYCFSLEDADRLMVGAEKVPGATAIPAGDYTMRITWSPRFGRSLPLIDGVEGFTGCRWHPGNTASDTEGCVLVGRKAAMGRVIESRLAFTPLFRMMRAADDILLTIRRTTVDSFTLEDLEKEWLRPHELDT